MLTKTKYRAIKPGQWSRTRVPNYECWQSAEDRYWGRRVRPGDEVDFCILPTYCTFRDFVP